MSETTTTEFPITEKYYKLTNMNGAHHGYEFKEGLNIDIYPWNTANCAPGGIYITTMEHMPAWLWYSDYIGRMYWIWDAEIDTRYPYNQETFKVKAHAVKLSNRRLIMDLPEWKDAAFQKAAVLMNRSYKTLSYYITDPCIEVYMAFVENGIVSYYIETKEKNLEAVTIRGELIRGMTIFDEDILLAAVKQNGRAIRFIMVPTVEMQRAAVTQNYLAFYCISDPPAEILRLAQRMQKAHQAEIIDPPTMNNIRKAAVRHNWCHKKQPKKITPGVKQGNGRLKNILKRAHK